MSFTNIPLLPLLHKALEDEGYTTPTPIQTQAIPAILDGRDVLGCAQTGTGKTAAFALPILHRLHEAHHRGPHVIRALIVTPTRELAIQIEEKFKTYGKHMKLRHAVIFGGVNQHRQVQQLKQGVDILVATPGRLIDLMQQKIISLKHIEIFTLDEADRMLDMGFINDIKKIIAQLPEKRQSLFFSATMPNDIIDLTKRILTNPVHISVTPISSTAETVRQAVLFVDQKKKQSLLTHVLNTSRISAALVFTRTKYGADRVARALEKNGISAAAIHGNKSQNARQAVLKGFKEGKIRVLVATDIAARGIDIDELAYVINYEIPNIPETYVHRIGRTGRAGAAGTAISFCDWEEKAYLKDIEKLTGVTIDVIEDHPFPLTGEAPTPKPKGPARKRGGRSHTRRRRG